MAQRAFVWSQDPPAVNAGNFRFSVQVSYIDSVTGDVHYDSQGLVVDVSVSLLTTSRAQIRDAVKAQADSSHGWTLGNDDVYFIDWSRELV